MHAILTYFPYIAGGITIAFGAFAMYATIRVGLGYPVILLNRGLIRISNNRKIAIELLQKDISKVGRSMVAFSDSGTDWFWGAVASQLEQKAVDGIRFTFFVSEAEYDSSKHETLSRLADRFPNTVKITKLTSRPPVDLRLIDGKHVHIAAHGIDENDNERPCWRNEGDVAPSYILHFVNDLIIKYQSQSLISRSEQAA